MSETTTTLKAVLQVVSSTAASVMDNSALITQASGSNGGGIVHHGMMGHEGGMTGDEGHVHMEEKMDDMMMQMLTTAKRMHYAASVIVGPILVILGLIGNILSIVVWTRRGMASSTGRYLTCLALADSGVLIWFLCIDSIQMIHPELVNHPAYAVFFAYLGYPFFFLFVILSIWYMVGVTVDRFIMVCLITKAKEYCNQSRANVGVFMITGLCFLINLPHFWSFTVDFDRGVNGTGEALVKTEFQKGPGGIRYEFWVHCIFLVLVPWFSVFTLNLLIIQKLSSSNRKMSSKKTAEAASKSKKSENQVTRLLLVVTFFFLFLIGFQCITQCFYMLMPEGFDKNIIDEAYAVAKLGVIVNSSINFLLYCFSGRRFRNELFMVLGLRRRDSLYSSDHYSTSGTHTTSTNASASSNM